MKTETVFKDTRLLDALDYIDRDLIAGAIEDLRIDECQPSSRKSTARAFIAFAACLVLLILSFPMANYITGWVSNFRAGAGSGTTENISSEEENKTDAEYYQSIPDELKIVPPPAVYTSPVELSYEEKRAIVWAFIKNNKDENKLNYSYNIRCYGKFGNACAVMIGSSDAYYSDAIRIETIGNVEFIFPNSQKMHIYYFGEFYSLEDAFERGIINEEELISIQWSKRPAFTYSETSAPVSLHVFEIMDILRAYVDLYVEVGEKDLDLSLRCYGQFHADRRHSYVVLIDQTGKTYESKVTEEEINGLIFEYPTEQKLIVYPYDKGVFYSLQEAFDAGLLTEEELYEVYLTYTQEQ